MKTNTQTQIQSVSRTTHTRKELQISRIRHLEDRNTLTPYMQRAERKLIAAVCVFIIAIVITAIIIH
jgi:hypothetical protein